MQIKEIDVKSVMTKSNLPVSDDCLAAVLAFLNNP